MLSKMASEQVFRLCPRQDSNRLTTRITGRRRWAASANQGPSELRKLCRAYVVQRLRPASKIASALVIWCPRQDSNLRLSAGTPSWSPQYSYKVVFLRGSIEV
jgi:hypothetical protein